MRATIIGFVIVIIASLLVILALNTPKNTTSSVKLTMESIQSDLKAGAQLIDVRTPEEYAAGFIDKAINLPLADIQAGQLPTATKDKKLYLYCRSGNRAAQAVSILQTTGYSNVINLGGMNDVIAIGGQEIK